MRLIDADTLKAEFTGNFHEEWHYTGIRAIIDIAPTVEAEPVRHGHWEFCAESVEAMWDCKCSVCGSIERPLQRHHYCPNCGAKMDEVEE